MPRNILERLSRPMAEQVETATTDERRAMCLPICKLAVKTTALSAPVVEQALQLLTRGLFTDKEITAPLQKLAEDLDDSYFEAQKLYQAGKEEKETYVSLFRRARAASAVLYSFSDDPFTAATWSIYEACAAMDGVEQAEGIVSKVLEEKR